MTRKKRVYVAGAYSADKVLDVFRNMNRGIRLSTQVFLMGYAPFSPWLDYHFALSARLDLDEDISLEHYYDYSMAWLEASDAVIVVLENHKQSRGTQHEIARAEELGIPVFFSLTTMDEYLKTLHL